MRYLKKYNEGVYNDDSHIGSFIDKILSYKSNDFTNIRLRFKNWEQREGYPDRIAIDFTNNISGEEESIILEKVDGGLRIYIGSTYYKDLRTQSVRSEGTHRIDEIFKSISEKSNNVKRHNRDKEVSKKILDSVNEEIIKGYFAEILELSDKHTIEKRKVYNTETHWEILISIPGFVESNELSTNSNSKITLNESNISILESIMSISKTIKESEGISTTIKFIDKEIRIFLNAIDPDSGRILFAQ